MERIQIPVANSCHVCECGEDLTPMYITNNAPHPIPVNMTTPNGLKLKSRDMNYVVDMICRKCGKRYKTYVTRYKYEETN